MSKGRFCSYAKFHLCKWSFMGYEWSFTHEHKHPQVFSTHVRVQVPATYANGAHHISALHLPVWKACMWAEAPSKRLLLTWMELCTRAQMPAIYESWALCVRINALHLHPKLHLGEWRVCAPTTIITGAVHANAPVTHMPLIGPGCQARKVGDGWTRQH